MVDPGIFGFSEIVENNLPYSITGWAQSWCSGQFDYIPPAGWMRSDCYCCDPVGSHNGCSYCAMSKVTCVPIVPPDAEPEVIPEIIPEEPPAEPIDYDIHKCNRTIGQTWCDVQQICLIETETPCNPIIPVDQVPDPQPINEPTGSQEPVYMEPIISQPECEPIADKPWSCGGVNEVDRYDCIDGKITLTEKDSTACGYQAPQESVQPEQPKIPVLLIMSLLGAGVLAYVIMKEKKP